MLFRISLNAYDNDSGHPVRVEFDATPAEYWDAMEALKSMVSFTNTPPSEKMAEVLDLIYQQYPTLPVPPIFNDFPVTGYTKHRAKGTDGGYDVVLWGDHGDFAQETIWWETKTPGVKVVADHGDLFTKGDVLPTRGTARSDYGEFIVPLGQSYDVVLIPQVVFRDGEPVQKMNQKGNPAWKFFMLHPFDYEGTGQAEAVDEPWRRWVSSQDFFAFAQDMGINPASAEKKLSDMVKLANSTGAKSDAASLAKPFYDWAKEWSNE